MIGSDEMAEIPLELESAGTLKMFALYPELQEVLEKGSVFFIDELNARLHPLLVRNFLLTFLNPEINTNHAQLVFTTHDTWQLSNQLLRRDEIWFVEKDEEGVSTLYSLADFVDEDGTRIRKDESYEKNYLIGKYGAIPTLKSIDILRRIRMARKDRTGNRKTREQRKQFKVPELGYYLIVTDTEATERCFFTGLHQALPEDVRNKLVIKVVETKTRAMIDKCLELTAYDAQYRIPWIVFDRDQVQGFDEIIKEAEDKGIQVGWSNPCFEIWMYAYFGSMPAIQDSWACCSDFGRVYETKTGQKYSKADEQMYGKLCKAGDEERQFR